VLGKLLPPIKTMFICLLSFCLSACEIIEVLIDLPSMAKHDLQVKFADAKQSETYRNSFFAKSKNETQFSFATQPKTKKEQLPKININKTDKEKLSIKKWMETKVINPFTNSIQKTILTFKEQTFDFKTELSTTNSKVKVEKEKTALAKKPATSTKTKSSKSIIKKPKPISTAAYTKRYDGIADRFAYPVGFPNASGYYIAQTFGVRNGHFQNKLHLGDDWNAVTGGNSDKGDPVYSIANGYVTESLDVGNGWGNIVRVAHKLPNGKIVESIYAHLDERMVVAGTFITIGQQVGTIGDADGSYWAHLHLEMRSKPGLPLGGGYAHSTEFYINPKKFIEQHL